MRHYLFAQVGQVACEVGGQGVLGGHVGEGADCEFGCVGADAGGVFVVDLPRAPVGGGNVVSEVVEMLLGKERTGA